MRKTYQGIPGKSKKKFEVIGEQGSGGAVTAAAGGGVGGVAARGRTPDRAGGVEDHSGRDRR